MITFKRIAALIADALTSVLVGLPMPNERSHEGAQVKRTHSALSAHEHGYVPVAAPLVIRGQRTVSNAIWILHHSANGGAVGGSYSSRAIDHGKRLARKFILKRLSNALKKVPRHLRCSKCELGLTT